MAPTPTLMIITPNFHWLCKMYFKTFQSGRHFAGKSRRMEILFHQTFLTIERETRVKIFFIFNKYYDPDILSVLHVITCIWKTVRWAISQPTSFFSDSYFFIISNPKMNCQLESLPWFPQRCSPCSYYTLWKPFV